MHDSTYSIHSQLRSIFTASCGIIHILISSTQRGFADLGENKHWCPISTLTPLIKSTLHKMMLIHLDFLLEKAHICSPF